MYYNGWHVIGWILMVTMVCIYGKLMKTCLEMVCLILENEMVWEMNKLEWNAWYMC